MSYQLNKISSTIWEVRCDLIPGCLTNSYVISSEKATYLIDSGLGSGTANEMAAFITAGKPVYLINTHGHWDHVWGNAFFKNAQIICHERCAETINRDWNTMLEAKGRFVDGSTQRFDVHISFADRLRLYDELELVYTPGHTDDSIAVYYKPERALFVGDLIGDDDTELLPSVKVPQSFLSSLDTCIQFDPSMYLSGHNDIKGPGIMERIRELFLEDRA